MAGATTHCVAELHKLLVARAFYPLLMCTMLGGAFVIARAYITGEIRYRFLVWDLFLAWIPYACAVLIEYALRTGTLTRRGAVIMSAAWLLMFPNAPYILTCFVHYGEFKLLAWWFDLGILLTFALAGCFLGAASLWIIHDLLRRRAGETMGWLFVLGVSFLSGFGIYLGRFGRYNSWDVLLRPHRIFADVLRRVIDPLGHPRTIGFTLMFGAMVLAIYLMFAAMRTRDTTAA